MKYGSVCSGVEAATMAWHHMGWKPSFFSEIEQFPCAVLQHHYPEVPLHGDFTTIGENDYEPIDLLVGGTPCQSFSIAGLRKGMADERGNLALEFLKLAQRTRPTWLVWENVPGVLSSNSGRDFGAFLGGLGEIGYGFAYRVLNAQYFGVPQRRRRVFVVGYLGDWRPPAKVLFERHSLQGHPAPSREKREETAKCLTAGIAQRYDSETETMICFEPRSPDGVPRISKDVCPTLNTMGGGQREPCVAFGWQNSSSQGDSVSETVSPTLDKSKTPAVAMGIPGNWIGRKPENGGQREPCVAFALQGAGKTSQNSQGSGWNEEVCYTTNCLDVHGVAYSFDSLSSNSMKSKNPHSGCRQVETCHTLDTASPTPAKNQGGIAIASSMQVRRLTPIECERLQGFPDNFTKIPYRNKTVDNCPDGPRYKAMGNSMAVPVMRWLGERIEMINGSE
jgi:DNA (cytosine-5)-methyltransferase 1